MLLQTNSYIVPKEKRAEHSRLLRRFRATLAKLGCDNFEVYEQVSANWSGADSNGRYVQIMRFRNRQHQIEVQQAERNDPSAQALIREFCELINFPYQQQQGLFAVGYYTSVLPIAPAIRPGESTTDASAESAAADDMEDGASTVTMKTESAQTVEPSPSESDQSVEEHGHCPESDSLPTAAAVDPPMPADSDFWKESPTDEERIVTDLPASNEPKVEEPLSFEMPENVEPLESASKSSEQTETEELDIFDSDAPDHALEVDSAHFDSASGQSERVEKTGILDENAALEALSDRPLDDHPAGPAFDAKGPVDFNGQNGKVGTKRNT